MNTVLQVAADALVILGLITTTLAVVGLVRMPGLMLRIHAATKAVFVGIVAILLSAIGTGSWEMIGRALLVIAILLATAPLSGHALALASVMRRHQRPRGEGERLGPPIEPIDVRDGGT